MYRIRNVQKKRLSYILHIKWSSGRLSIAHRHSQTLTLVTPRLCLGLLMQQYSGMISSQASFEFPEYRQDGDLKC